MHLDRNVRGCSIRGGSKRTGHYPFRAAAAGYCGTAGTTSAPRMGMGGWILSMEWGPVCLGARTLGQPTPAGSCVGSRPLGSSGRGLCLDRRILALARFDPVCFETLQ